MEKDYVTLDECKQNVLGRSNNAMRVKNIRAVAHSEQTLDRMRKNPYLEIWDIDYYSTSDSEDNDEGKESESEESSADSEDD